MTVAVLIPTFRRNKPLESAIRSVWQQSQLPDEIVISDNSPNAEARALIESLRTHSPVPLVYVHADQPGVSHARNVGFAATSADIIVQLDDDETASNHWLESILKSSEVLDVPIVFGPVKAEVSVAGAVRQEYLCRLFSRLGAETDEPLSEPLGCGNALINRARLRLPDPVFDPAANEIGGEDDVLFNHLKDQGVQFGWSAQAVVYEHVQDNRQTWRTLLLRSYAYGQGPSQACLHGSRRNWLKLLAWMGIGAGQVLAFGLALPFARLISPKAAALCVDKAAQGMGKLIWSDKLSPRIYGAAALQG